MSVVGGDFLCVHASYDPGAYHLVSDSGQFASAWFFSDLDRNPHGFLVASADPLDRHKVLVENAHTR